MNGSGVTQITNNPCADWHLSCSLDGSKLAFRSDREGGSGIFVINADGSNPVNISKNPALDYGPFWAPDGKKRLRSSPTEMSSTPYLW